MGPRRPSSATDVDSRMPFASAEALLWGPEMKQQHAHLLTEMRTLQKHHDEYEARIRSTEHVAEAAEAATSRVRHLEQQLAAIEAEDDDKAFEKWAAGEMTRLGIFVDTNKHVRQKQIELDNVVSHAVDDLDKLKQVPRELKGILRRLDLLETGRNQDARRIESLEEEVTRLQSTRRDPKSKSKSNTAGPQTVSKPQHGMLRSMTPSQLLNAGTSEVTSDTDDEDLILMPGFAREEIQVPRSPEMRERSSNEVSKTETDAETFDPQLYVATSGRGTETNPNTCSKIEPLTDKTITRKRKQPTKEPHTQRLTRAQAKKIQEQDAEERKPHVTDNESLLPPTQLVEPALSSRKKQKTAHDQGSDSIKARSSTAMRPTGRAPATAKRNAAANQSKTTAIEPTQLVTRSPAKSNIPEATTSPTDRRYASPSEFAMSVTNEQEPKSLIVILRSPQKATRIERSESDDTKTTVADRAKKSPRKAALTPLSRSKAIPKPSSTRIPGGRSKPAVSATARILATMGRKPRWLSQLED
ncbi:uncharacterized protein J4E88_004390 [Alternaria novae-zelandiae]|uniref:uncharacterized protein n=1 Tax=Alternaria novae-zelandiae TaxID=430562 RepID=UPI0020C3D0EA|nr:uncharacterized protein J4E88_004390 [Alternaria novae-zelandiae]KAI4684948.1 hypothetical protein J4E88_004390 [Alternaria novae-zelandiae]